MNRYERMDIMGTMEPEKIAAMGKGTVRSLVAEKSRFGTVKIIFDID